MHEAPFLPRYAGVSKRRPVVFCCGVRGGLGAFWLGRSAKRKAAKGVQVCVVVNTRERRYAVRERAMVYVEARGFRVITCRQTERNGARGGE
jgi:hypothetical protein